MTRFDSSLVFVCSTLCFLCPEMPEAVLLMQYFLGLRLWIGWKWSEPHLDSMLHRLAWLQVVPPCHLQPCFWTPCVLKLSGWILVLQVSFAVQEEHCSLTNAYFFGLAGEGIESCIVFALVCFFLQCFQVYPYNSISTLCFQIVLCSQLLGLQFETTSRSYFIWYCT